MTYNVDNSTACPAPVPAGKSNAYQPLKRLTPRHMKMIELHLAGRRNIEIAEAFNTSPSRVSITLHNPTVQAYLDGVRKVADLELKSLLLTAVDAIRRALTGDDIDVALKATDLLVRAEGRYRDAKASPETAEDVIARILELAKSSVDTVREVARPPISVIDMIPAKPALEKGEAY